MANKMAIIGDGDSVLVFTAVGIDAYPVALGDDVSSLIKKLAKTYKIIFITDDIALQNDEVISRYKDKAYPIILSVPSKTGKSDYANQILDRAVIKTLGVNIFLNENNDEEGR